MTGFALVKPVLAASDCSTLKGDVQSLGCLADSVTSAINAGFVLFGGLTLIYLIFGAIKFVTSRGDPKAIQSAKGTMTYAALAALLILGLFAIVNFVTGTLGLPDILSNFSFSQ